MEKNMVSKIDLFLNRIIKEEDNNNSLKEAPSKSQAAAFIQILKSPFRHMKVMLVGIYFLQKKLLFILPSN